MVNKREIYESVNHAVSLLSKKFMWPVNLYKLLTRTLFNVMVMQYFFLLAESQDIMRQMQLSTLSLHFLSFCGSLVVIAQESQLSKKVSQSTIN